MNENLVIGFKSRKLNLPALSLAALVFGFLVLGVSLQSLHTTSVNHYGFFSERR